MAAMESCTTLDGLKSTFAGAWKESGHDADIKAAYDALKAKFEAKAPEAV
jgi:hypothetical protein